MQDAHLPDYDVSPTAFVAFYETDKYDNLVKYRKLGKVIHSNSPSHRSWQKAGHTSCRIRISFGEFMSRTGKYGHMRKEACDSHENERVANFFSM
jgi:hypothetical protein